MNDVMYSTSHALQLQTEAFFLNSISDRPTAEVLEHVALYFVGKKLLFEVMTFVMAF
jgi:hypothetical protein